MAIMVATKTVMTPVMSASWLTSLATQRPTLKEATETAATITTARMKRIRCLAWDRNWTMNCVGMV